jgi:hypothetical protein
MQILLSTTGTLQTINIVEFGGRIFEHPVVDFNLHNEFSTEEIRNSETILSLLIDGHITLTDEYGRLVTPESLKQLDDNQGLGEVLNNSNIANQSIDMNNFRLENVAGINLDGYEFITTGFSANKILSINSTGESGNAIIATAKVFNDLGTGINDIWSADKVIDYFNQVTSGTGLLSLNGLTTATQTFAVSNDTNINLSISSTTSTHTFTTTWAGILSVARGGTNNDTFTDGQILTYDTTLARLESSGFTFNDAGITSSDIWSAGKIIDYFGVPSLIFNSAVQADTLTTTSTTDVLMTSLQFTDIVAGTYLANFGTSVLHGSTSAEIFISIYVNGTQVPGSERLWKRGSQQGDVTGGIDLAGFPLILTTTSTVEIRWRTSTGTATSINRHFTMLRVDRVAN